MKYRVEYGKFVSPKKMPLSELTGGDIFQCDGITYLKFAREINGPANCVTLDGYPGYVDPKTIVWTPSEAVVSFSDFCHVPEPRK